MVKKYDPSLIYFVVDTFLAMSNKEFDEFKELYMDYKIPFWMNTRAETITEYRAASLEEMNMLRMNIGIEHGNFEYRKKYLRRNVSDELQISSMSLRIWIARPMFLPHNPIDCATLSSDEEIKAPNSMAHE